MRIYFYSLNLNFNDFKVLHALSIKVGFVSGFSGSRTVPARDRLFSIGTSHPAEGLRQGGIFGCNVNADMSCAFHANNFVAQNLPTASGGPPGSFWRGAGNVVMVN